MQDAEQKQSNSTEMNAGNPESGDHTTQIRDHQHGPVVQRHHEKPLVHDITDPEWEKKKAHYKSSIENAFKALIPGMQISINRTRPNWASGWLDTLPVEFDENGHPNIDLQTIKDTFGGENLQLRFLDQNGQFLYAKTVHFRGIPPKENGFELENPSVKARRELIELEQKNNDKKQTANNDKLFDRMLDRQEKSYSEMVKMLTATSKQQSDPFAGMTAMMSLMEKFDRFRGGNGSPQPDDIGGMLTNLLGMFGNMQQQQKQPAAPQLSGIPTAQSAGVFYPPSVRPQPPPQAQAQVPQPQQRGATQVPQPQAQVPQPQPQRPIPVPENAMDELEEIDLVDEICGMDDMDIAETVAELMERLGDERGQRVFQCFAQMSGEQEQPEQPETSPPPPPAATTE